MGQELEVLSDNGELVLSELSFKKPYKYEGKTYDKVDLSGLENLRVYDMIEVNKALEKKGSLGIMQEMSIEFAVMIASKATGLPEEFFKWLPMCEGVKLKNRITGFLYEKD